MNITRTITTYKATAVKLYLENGQPKADVIGEATFVGTSPSKADARKALDAAGFDVPRGTKVTIEVVSSNTYACSVEQFISVAHLIEPKASSPEAAGE